MSISTFSYSMKARPVLRSLAVLSLIAGWLFSGEFSMSVSAAESPRERLSLDANWKFHLGDDWPKALRLDKAGAKAGLASANQFSDVSWRTVNLSHDWAIELPFDKNADMSHGYRAVGPGFETNSIGWYRRAFEPPKLVRSCV